MFLGQKRAHEQHTSIRMFRQLYFLTFRTTFTVSLPSGHIRFSETKMFGIARNFRVLVLHILSTSVLVMILNFFMFGNNDLWLNV